MLSQLLEAGPLGQHAPDHRVVPLAAALLVRRHRVAVEHPASPAVSQRAPLDRLEVAELDAAVGEDHAEQPRELRRADYPLDPVERADDRLARLLVDQDHHLQLGGREVNGEDAPEVARLPDHHIHLHGPRAPGRGQVEEIGEAAPVAVHGAGAGHRLSRLVAHLLGQVDVGQPHQAGPYVAVHRALAYRQHVSHDRPYGLDAPAPAQVPAHGEHDALQLLGGSDIPSRLPTSPAS